MKRVLVSDMTLPQQGGLSFKEKIEIVRQLDHLHADAIHMPAIENAKADALLIRTVCAFVKYSTICVPVGASEDGVRAAAAAVSGAKSARLAVSLPTSAIQMEYSYHKKAPKMLELAQALFALSVSLVPDVEFIAEDATRADREFLRQMLQCALEAGVHTVTLCDDEGAMLPDEFAAFVTDVMAQLPAGSDTRVGILCRNTIGMANASAVMAIRAGADEIKCGVGVKDIPDTEVVVDILNQCGERCGFSTQVNHHELHRITKQIDWICDKESAHVTGGTLPIDGDAQAVFDIHDDAEAVGVGVKRLGYELSDEDMARVYEEFQRVAEKKTVTLKDLDALIASVALQVPPTYRLVNYVVNSGNVISTSAQITLDKQGQQLTGIAIGDGPIDASFRALEQMTGHHFELDDFQIQSVTQGKEAVGSALVKLRNNGKLYSGKGISTDIIGASIRAYINAVNKIVYEEANQ